MARRTLTVTISDEGRDKGKVFLITEMPASQGEEWAERALCALAKSGVELPDDYEKLGMAAIAALTFQALAGISFADAKPLLDEMMDCVRFVGDPARPEVTRALIEDDIEEIFTRLKLKRDVFDLHTSFFTNAGRSTSTKPTRQTGASGNT